jgi:hypothetical protein
MVLNCHPMPHLLLQMLDSWLVSLLGPNYSVPFVAAAVVVDYDDD